MTAKEYLSKIQIYRRAIMSTQLRIEELEHQASGIRAITYDRDRVQVSPENRMEDIMVKIDAQAAKMARQIEKYHREVEKREKQIAGMDRLDYAEILRLRYIELNSDGRQMTLEEISCRMHLSYFRVKHLHGEALAEFARRYKVSTY